MPLPKSFDPKVLIAGEDIQNNRFHIEVHVDKKDKHEFYAFASLLVGLIVFAILIT